MTRIPSRVVFPFGYRVKIKQVTDTEMNEQAADADGLWEEETRTIYIRKNLPITRRRYLLAHELFHAWLDWQHLYMDKGIVKN